ncbi:hypothetical protein [Halobaculum sp. EA56]|uniref:hypothetical protein n=1 Tax=Halobaculum sp. EA56 TaxID=3421648 RepID=UPI003EB97970
MGFFERVGRQVEQFKRTAKAEAERSADYRCRTCEERFRTDHEECPECGGGPVVSTADGE